MATKQQRRQKHVPQRTCIICRQKKDKRTLTRVVRKADGGIIIDPSGKQPGRGAYLCSDQTCWDKAVASNALDRALRTELDPKDRQELAAFRTESE